MSRKFNIIDIIIILIIVIGLVVAGIFFVKYLNNDKSVNTTQSEQNKTKLNFTIEILNVSENNAKMYKKGQEVKFDAYGKCKGRIEDVVIEPYKIVTKNTEVGEVLVTEIPDRYTAILIIKTDVVKDKMKYSCNGERISIGKSLPIKIKGAAAANCYITDLYEVK